MSLNKPLVSIVTACYNSEKYISDTINSVLNQTYQNWELLLVDDCSTDASISIIRSFEKADKRIKVYKLTENSGPAVTRNKAIKEAKGRFIAFLDSDDRWLPDKLEKQIAFMLAKGYSLTHTGYELIDESGKTLNKIIRPTTVLSYNDMLYSNKIGCLTAVYDQKQLGKIYMPLLLKRQDYALWLKILKTGEKAYGLSEILSQYRKTESSLSSNKINLIRWNWKLLREVENMSFIKSAYYLTCNIVLKLKS
ncbi:glycosyltransferase family 2 protein [Winogradskyella forsetii]|uniref:glycosyltransferase family 2 protein n=1 Tax=Winogradskyella forsetii TaxID=2686077 RepID=UPI0015BECA95|nr:glycosyltransferase family 2 protein [Winogradskyella forsetii]